ncbi:BglG family transcription antiterminator [Oceanobacillus sojae]|uniref:BglG family transcription antiterminator n=1 Tax=Oceanobacillus sojae TaxID=582851 RepID=UPI0021A8697A|nr:BglG family transcription antiterminator [Oceanobacillus sojae]MCT1902488.1 BglG family transcription antiterminator [Oceanobacillus sojae]
MHIDERSNQLLQELINNPNATLKSLEAKMGINQRQIKYSLEKINSHLMDIHHVQIERTPKGQFIMPGKVTEMFLEAKGGHSYVLSENERVDILLIIILNRSQDLSLTHLTELLDFSRNTITKVIKQAKEKLKPYQIELNYSRIEGYQLLGGEYEKRKLLFDIIQQYVKNRKDRELLEKYGDIDSEDLKVFYHKLEQCEKTLGYTFSDNMITIVAYCLAVWQNRVRQGKTVEENEMSKFDLADKKEYYTVEKVFHELRFINESELHYVTLQLMIMNVFSTKNFYISESMNNIKKALQEMLDKFERVSVIDIPQKELLVEKLYIHMKPAYYRIKFDLIDNSSLALKFDQKLTNLHRVIKLIVEPIESALSKKVPESELVYITIIIGGWLRQHGIDFNKKILAAVVCPNGHSVSVMIHVTLTSIFKEFLFLNPMSIREFSNYEGEVDIVFTTDKLDTNVKQFLVEPIMSEMDIRKLQSTVFTELYGFSFSSIDMDAIMNIIEEHADVKNRAKLMDKLNKYLLDQNPDATQTNMYDMERTLDDFLTNDTIQMADRAKTWEEAIRTVAQPLLNSGYIKESYVDAVMENCRRNSDYIMLANRVVIPHAKPEEGVLKLGMSLLNLKEPVEFPNGQCMNLICFIAAEDKEKHINPLLQLRRLAEDEYTVNQIKKAGSEEDIEGIINHFVNEVI